LEQEGILPDLASVSSELENLPQAKETIQSLDKQKFVCSPLFKELLLYIKKFSLGMYVFLSLVSGHPSVVSYNVSAEHNRHISPTYTQDLLLCYRCNFVGFMAALDVSV
jgi:hypothetical protein